RHRHQRLAWTQRCESSAAVRPHTHVQKAWAAVEDIAKVQGDRENAIRHWYPEIRERQAHWIAGSCVVVNCGPQIVNAGRRLAVISKPALINESSALCEGSSRGSESTEKSDGCSQAKVRFHPGVVSIEFRFHLFHFPGLMNWRQSSAFDTPCAN